ncbi:M28 family metallopeptidase [Paludisphaera mucosa]|uniref:M20/M25/M40 family metallo-hydrolase n=1 Tax=Paludisphaera mucosa TaxID=3030827 RepID=A0ABT6F6E7_9BACT|nr:M20/M25/M40 family metallo-hydrolase [Paludisphaera mucosa]MDG3002965.1 M20/M25/M40 family metallo-hydrolase [Paludisphaera mucosa]
MHDASIRPPKLASRVVSIARLVPVATIATLLGLSAGEACASEPERTNLERWVRQLASPELEGRRGEGARKAAGLIVEEFQRLKLEPLFQGQYVQEVPPAPPVEVLGRNVGAVLRGSDPSLAERCVVVSAHYDHLGVRQGVLYPGADDNASGVAMMLETARCLAGAIEKPKRSVVFLAFDQEESGLYGSRYFAAHSPFAVENIELFITADMIGRSLGGVCGDFFFVMGTEHVPALRPWLTEAAAGRPVRLGILGADLLVLNRSDYGPFRTRKIPFLFFSTGENPRYHAPSDTPETLDYPKLTEISRVIHGVTSRAADAPTLPRWNDRTDNPIEEALTIRDVLRTLDANREKLKINAAQGFVIANALRTLDGVAGRGKVTPAERSLLIQAARVVLMTTF